MTAADFLEQTQEQFPRIPAILNDGTVLSIQASPNHHSIPRTVTGPYEAVEIAILSNEDIEPEYCVPLADVDAVIEKHGGINEEHTFDANLIKARHECFMHIRESMLQMEKIVGGIL